MTAADLEKFVSDFLSVFKNARKEFEEATNTEEELNNATQDLLHTCELNPDALDDVDVVAILHDLRIKRREAKKELEVTRLFWAWAEPNLKIMNTLEQRLGEMRKIIRRQPLDSYRYKTDVLNNKDSWLSAKTEPVYEQLIITGWDKVS